MFPGTSTMNQLTRIVEITGRPSSEDMEAIRSDFAATMIDSLPPSKKRSIAELFPHAQRDALDLLSRLLQFNPNKRLSAEDAVMHPYVVQFRDEQDEPVCPEPIHIPIDDNVKYSIQDYRNKLYADIKLKEKDQKKKLAELRAKKKEVKKKKKKTGSNIKKTGSRIGDEKKDPGVEKAAGDETSPAPTLKKSVKESPVPDKKKDSEGIPKKKENKKKKEGSADDKERKKGDTTDKDKKPKKKSSSSKKK